MDDPLLRPMSYLSISQEEEEDDIDLNELALTGDDIPFSTDSVKAQFASLGTINFSSLYHFPSCGKPNLTLMRYKLLCIYNYQYIIEVKIDSKIYHLCTYSILFMIFSV